MRPFFILFLKELRAFFLSPLAYVVMALFMFMNGWFLARFVEALRVQASQHSLLYLMFEPGWFWMGYFFLFPLLTMRLFAEERKLGTLETLFTAPVRTSQVVLGKYFATLTLYLIVLAPVILYFLLFQAITGETAAFTPGSLLGTTLALVLIGMFNTAIGCFASSLTSNQLIAAMLAFVGVLIHYFLGFLQYFGAGTSSLLAEKLSYFSTVEHMRAYSDGLIDSRPIVYYVSFSAVILVLTHHVLEHRKWKV